MFLSQEPLSWTPIPQEGWLERARDCANLPGAGRLELLEALQSRLMAGLPEGLDPDLARDLVRALRALETEEGRRALVQACEGGAFHPFVLRGLDPLFNQSPAFLPWSGTLARWSAASRGQGRHPCTGSLQPLLVEARHALSPAGSVPILALLPLAEAPRVVRGSLLSLRPWGGGGPPLLGGKLPVEGLVWPLAPEDWALWSVGAERSGDLFEARLVAW